MKALVDILRDRYQLGHAAFVDRYPSPVLIHRLRTPDGVNLSAETQFARPVSSGAGSVGGEMLSMGLANAKAHVHLNRVLGSLGATGPRAIVDGSIVVFRAQKPAGPAGFSIGRASDAAYRLDFPKISKVHAHLRMDAGGFALADAGSRNGTQLSGVPVPAHSAVALSDGALLQFSQYTFLFYSPAGLYRVLGED
jgi:hypothetical protein